MGATSRHGVAEVPTDTTLRDAIDLLDKRDPESPWADHAAIQALARDAEDSELFIYPGNAHLFADPSSPEYKADAAALLLSRTLVFLERVG